VESLKAFRLDKKEDVAFGETNINEFVELNEALNQLINKNKTDYLSLKEFTENASHEFQTPLAIIKNKSELLLQNNLSEIDMIEVVKINEAASRLSKIKNGLSMLTKMDNDQFSDVESIKLAEFIDKKTKHFEELIDLKQIGLTKKFKAHPIVQWNNTLAYMLVTNLINNAIKHNIKGGTLNIILDSKKLTIENTGKPLTDAPIQYFDRFKKGSTSADSSGLGLALIKKICDIYNMEIHYTNVGMLHVFTIDF
jgi:signal transduction histidine kinase